MSPGFKRLAKRPLQIITVVGIMLSLGVTAVGAPPANRTAASTTTFTWNHAQGNAERTGYNPNATLGTTATQLWQSNLKTAGSFNVPDPVLGNGRLYYSAGDGAVYALDPNTGKVIWHTAIPNQFATSSAYDSTLDQVYVLTRPTTFGALSLYALNAATGAVVWSAPTGTQYMSSNGNSPVVDGTRVYVTADGSGNTLFCYDTKSGKLLWSSNVSGDAPAISGGKVFLNYVGGEMSAYDGSTGQRLWAARGAGWSGGGIWFATASGGRVYGISGDYTSYLLAFDATTGAELWRYPVKQQSGRLAFDGTYLWAPDGTGLTVLNAATGAVVKTLAVCPPTSLAIGATTTFAACGDGRIFAIDRTTYKATFLASGAGPLALDGNRLYYMAGDQFNGYTVAALVASAVDGTASTVTVSPQNVPADGTHTATITATLVNTLGAPQTGIRVALQASGGSSIIAPITATTNASGVVTFTVKDSKTETITYAVQDVSDNITLAKSVTISFIPPPAPVSPTLSTIKASPTTVPADGGSTATVTVALLDINRSPVANKLVTLRANGNNTNKTAVTDYTGTATFWLGPTMNAGTVVYGAVDSTDNVTLAQTATITYTSVIFVGSNWNLPGSFVLVRGNGTHFTGGTAVDILRDKQVVQHVNRAEALSGAALVFKLNSDVTPGAYTLRITNRSETLTAPLTVDTPPGN